MSTPELAQVQHNARVIFPLLFDPGVRRVRDKAGQVTLIRAFSGGGARGLDYAGLRYLTQNPNSRSEFARRAQRGARIGWVIDTANERWLLRFENGQLFTL